jgi:hypothetical protein
MVLTKQIIYRRRPLGVIHACSRAAQYKGEDKLLDDGGVGTTHAP